MIYEVIVVELEKFEDFLEEWQQVSAIIISTITSFLIPLLIYRHQQEETNEKIRQGIISVIEEVEMECNTVKKIAVLCKDASDIGASLETTSCRDDYIKSIQIAKGRLSKFKTLSQQLPSTDKIRKFGTELIQNRNKKVLIAKHGKKIKIKRLEELLSSIYKLLETNYHLRIEVINKIPEVDPLTEKDWNISDSKEEFVLENVRDTFAFLAFSLSDLSYNSDFIIKTWEDLRSEIY